MESAGAMHLASPAAEFKAYPPTTILFINIQPVFFSYHLDNPT